MRITHLGIKKLFNDFDYDFNIEGNQNVFILTGPNGYGKTTILDIVKQLSEKNLDYFYQLPFSEINIEFDNDNAISVISKDLEDENETTDTEIVKERKLSLIWSQKGENISSLDFNGQTLKNAHNVIDRYSYRGLANTAFDYLAEEQHFGQLSLFISGLSVYMLPSSRLSSVEFDEEQHMEITILTIKEVSDKLKHLLNSYYLKYLKTVNNSNSGIFDKLLQTQTSITEDEYKEISSRLSQELRQLHDWGLSTEKSIRPYSEEHKDILTLYIDELENNLSIYHGLYSRLLLFREILNSKHFTNKTILFSPTEGLIARRKDGSKLDLSKLSSGEQHEVIMLYHSIFEAGKKSILLIDEPENSLHVAWQLDYLREIESIAKSIDIQVLIATHSPQIIGERWDECYDLYEAANHDEFSRDSSSER